MLYDAKAMIIASQQHMVPFVFPIVLLEDVMDLFTSHSRQPHTSESIVLLTKVNWRKSVESVLECPLIASPWTPSVIYGLQAYRNVEPYRCY